MKFNKLFLIAISSLFLASCDPDEDAVPFYTPKGTYDSGVLVLNEGEFPNPDASISYISFDLNTSTNNIFGLENNAPIGKTGQSIGFYNDLAYIVVNGDDKIEVVNRYSMKKTVTIASGLNSPRYITFLNGKGYVTCWGEESNASDDYVAVIDLSNNQVIKNISVVEGPEHITEYNTKLYVSHAGGWSQNNKLSIINGTTDVVEGAPIVVGDVPNELIVNNGNLWIFCAGNPNYAAGGETPAKIVKMNLSTNALTTFKTFAGSTYVTNMSIFGSYIYYSFGNYVYKEIMVQTNPVTVIKSFNTNAVNIYSMAVKNNLIYVGDAPTFDGNGNVKIFANGDRTETDGSGAQAYPLGKLLKTVNVGKSPNGFYFNQ